MTIEAERPTAVAAAPSPRGTPADRTLRVVLIICALAGHRGGPAPVRRCSRPDLLAAAALVGAHAGLRRRRDVRPRTSRCTARPRPSPSASSPWSSGSSSPPRSPLLVGRSSPPRGHAVPPQLPAAEDRVQPRPVVRGHGLAIAIFRGDLRPATTPPTPSPGWAPTAGALAADALGALAIAAVIAVYEGAVRVRSLLRQRHVQAVPAMGVTLGLLAVHQPDGRPPASVWLLLAVGAPAARGLPRLRRRWPTGT